MGFDRIITRTLTGLEILQVTNEVLRLKVETLIKTSTTG